MNSMLSATSCLEALLTFKPGKRNPNKHGSPTAFRGPVLNLENRRQLGLTRQGTDDKDTDKEIALCPCMVARKLLDEQKAMQA